MSLQYQRSNTPNSSQEEQRESQLFDHVRFSTSGNNVGDHGKATVPDLVGWGEAFLFDIYWDFFTWSSPKLR